MVCGCVCSRYAGAGHMRPRHPASSAFVYAGTPRGAFGGCGKAPTIIRREFIMHSHGGDVGFPERRG